MGDNIYIKVNPSHINYINRIMEGYEYLGIVSTMDRINGLLVIRATADTREDVCKILDNLAINIEFVSPTPNSKGTVIE